MSRKHKKNVNEQIAEKNIENAAQDDQVEFTEEKAENDTEEQSEKADDDIDKQSYSAKESNSDEIESREDARRNARRHRRRAEQRNAALITTILLAIVTVLILFGVKKLSNIIASHQAAEDYAEQSASESAAEASSIVIAEPSTETETVETESVDYLQNVVDSCIQEMPIEDKVAQLFIVTPEQLTGAESVQQAGDATQDCTQQECCWRDSLF
jgi:cation transport ATPase